MLQMKVRCDSALTAAAALLAGSRQRWAAAAHLETPHAVLGAMGDCLMLI